MRAAHLLLLTLSVLGALPGMLGCPAIKIVKRHKKTATNKELSLHFKLKNDGLTTYTNYVFTVNIPRGVKHSGSVALITKIKDRIAPTVTDGLLLWRFPKLPPQALIKFSTNFQVDKYCVPEGMLAFDANGYQLLNGNASCATGSSPGVAVVNSDYCLPPEQASTGTSGLGFVTHASSGMDCVQEGLVAPLSFPSVYDCYQYCSTQSLSSPWYFRMRTFASGATECSCVGDTCHVTVPGGSSPGRERRYVRDLQTTDTVTETNVYRAEQLAAPTAQPTRVPTARPRAVPTMGVANPQNASLTLIEDGPHQAMLNIEQLALGYHSFLGLLPHEQQGTYMRRPIFKLHLDPEYSLVHLQSQFKDTLVFDAPREYFITSGHGICYWDTSSTSTTTIYDTSSVKSVWEKHGIGAAPIKVSISFLPKKPGEGAGDADEGGGLPELVGPLDEFDKEEKENQKKGTSYSKQFGEGTGAAGPVTIAFGNSKESREGRAYGSMGYRYKMQTSIKRPYYTAGLRLDRFIADSFTDEFKDAAKRLANTTYNLATVVQFIHTFGNYVFDTAEMGAMAYVSNYFTEDTSKMSAQRLASKQRNKNLGYLVTSQTATNITDESEKLDERVINFKTSAVTSVGEYATSAGAADDCRIGNQLIPQMIGFNLRPIWDTAIPLGLFMGSAQAARFRSHLKNATDEMLILAENCKDGSGNLCKEANGTCVIDLASQRGGLYDFKCVPSNTAVDAGPEETYDHLVYMLKGGGQEKVQAVLKRTETINDPFARAWEVYDKTETRQLTSNENFPVFLPGEDGWTSYTVTERHWEGGDKTLYLSLVVCPVIATPVSRRGEIPDNTCYRIYWGCFYGVGGKSKDDDYYFVEFKISKHQRSPKADSVKFKLGKNNHIADAMKGGRMSGGEETTDPSRHDWTYSVDRLLNAIEKNPWPFGNGYGKTDAKQCIAGRVPN